MTTYAKIAGRLLGSTAALGVLGIYAATRWKIASNVQTGIIANAGRQGLLIKTNELSLQRSHVSTGHMDGEMHMSLLRNKELVKRAKEYCEKATFVSVHYNEYLIRNIFLAESARRVSSIEPVEESNSHVSHLKGI